MKLTWPTSTQREPNANFSQSNHIPSAILGLALGWLGFALGPQWFVLGLRRFLDTNMLVSVTRNDRVGHDPQREPPTQAGSRSGEIQA